MVGNAPRLDARSWALLLTLSILWSASFVFIKIGASALSVVVIVFLRVGLAAAVLLIVIAARRSRLPSQPGILARYGFMGLFNNVLPGLLIVYATPKVGAGAASILNATAPIFALLIAHVSTADERITPAKLAGIALGIAGIVVMVGPRALAGLSGGTLAVGAMVLASFFYGIAAVIGRGFREIEPAVSAAAQLSASTVLLLPLILMADRPWTFHAPALAPLAAVVALALVSTALAYVLFFELIGRAGATNAILVTLLIPVSGLLLGWLLLGETVTWTEIAGMSLIAAGLAAIDGRVLARALQLLPARGGSSSEKA
jgi:drug/metabolite transporter (DMT)-like permease